MLRLRSCCISGTSTTPAHEIVQRYVVLTDWVDLGRHLLRCEATVRVVDIGVSTSSVGTVVLRLGRIHLGSSEFATISHFYFCCNFL